MSGRIDTRPLQLELLADELELTNPGRTTRLNVVWRGGTNTSDVRMELELAEDLRPPGYTVTGGHGDNGIFAGRFGCGASYVGGPAKAPAARNTLTTNSRTFFIG